MPHIPDWARAHGPPVFGGQIRQTPDDFVVDERLTIEFEDAGEHDWLRVRKTGANTHWVAEQLARHASIPVRDVGYAGLKDRHAVTSQWFSVRRRPGTQTDWDSFGADCVEILERRAHSRKLKRGAHRGNQFRIAIRGADVLPMRGAIEHRLALMDAQGVPNYFGEQRFGRNGANIELGRAVTDGRRVSRHRRSIGISAIRSFHFNESLSARVSDGTWNVLVPGDVANLDGSGSVFVVDQVTADLEQRCEDMDIHPCGSLPGIDSLGVRTASRPLRMRVPDLEWKLEDGVLWLSFKLGKGSYATAVLRELVALEQDVNRAGPAIDLPR